MSNVRIISSDKYSLHRFKWPIGDHDIKTVCLISDLEKFWSLFSYKKVFDTLNTFDRTRVLEYLKSYNEIENPRIIENSDFNKNRKWNTLGFGTSFVLTSIIGLLEDYKVFSVPKLNGNISIFKIPYWINFWNRLLAEDIELLVYGPQSEWINTYKHKQID